ncbi:MAG: hypothetical protein RLO17_17205 [Cyclobacteriaceae bacterium]
MERCSTGKKIYYSLHDAEEALIDAWGRNHYRAGGGPISIYECHDCGHFHWTSREPMNERLKKALEDGSISNAQQANDWWHKLK